MTVLRNTPFREGPPGGTYTFYRVSPEIVLLAARTCRADCLRDLRKSLSHSLIFSLSHSLTHTLSQPLTHLAPSTRRSWPRGCWTPMVRPSSAPSSTASLGLADFPQVDILGVCQSWAGKEPGWIEAARKDTGPRKSVKIDTCSSRRRRAPTRPRQPQAVPLPQKAVCGGIPGSFLEPLARSWSHFVGTYCQKLTNSVQN